MDKGLSWFSHIWSGLVALNIAGVVGRGLNAQSI